MACSGCAKRKAEREKAAKTRYEVVGSDGQVITTVRHVSTARELARRRGAEVRKTENS